MTTAKKQPNSSVFRIDSFAVPEASRAAFMAKVQETKELLASRNLAHLPVLATEDCEAFLSRFNAKHVHAHDLSREARREPPYAVTGPTSLDPSFASAVDIASPDLPASRRCWSHLCTTQVRRAGCAGATDQWSAAAR